MGFGIKKEAGSNTTPSDIVNFDKLTPTTVGVVFDPDTPATEDILYVSSVDASTWIWNGTAYITYSPPATATTEWYLLGTTIDAGSNKTAPISRSGAIVVGGDSYFTDVRVGRGRNNIVTNTVVGNGTGNSISTGTNSTFNGYRSGYNMTTGTANTFAGSLSGNKTTTGSYNVSFGESALYNNTTGGSNTAIGNQSLLGNISGIYTVSLGRNAGRFIADGATANTITNYSVFLGNETKALADNQSNQIVIGYNAIGKGSNTVNIGNTSITNTYLNGAVTFNNAFTFPTTDGTANYFLKTNGSGTVTWGVAGLSFFSEAQSTTAPNATVYANSLTAVSTTTNADYVMVAKGSGAILANIPDNTTTGGNKRGNFSLDLQRSRTDASYVASGQYSVILGGANNRVTSDYSMAGGNLSQCSGARSFAYGSGCTAGGYCSIALSEGATASGDNAFAHGLSAQATGYASVAIGRNAVSSNVYSMAFGAFTIADANSSIAFNNNAHTFGVTGRIVFSSTGIGTRGDAQSSKLVLRKLTTGNTPTILTSDNGSAVSANQLTLQNNNSIRFKGTIIGRQSGSTNTSAWDIDGIIQRGVGVATTTLLISNVNVVQNTPAWGTPTLTANTTLGCLTVSVIGALTTNIQWTCVIDTTEVIYA